MNGQRATFPTIALHLPPRLKRTHTGYGSRARWLKISSLPSEIRWESHDAIVGVRASPFWRRFARYSSYHVFVVKLPDTSKDARGDINIRSISTLAVAGSYQDIPDSVEAYPSLNVNKINQALRWCFAASRNASHPSHWNRTKQTKSEDVRQKLRTPLW